MLVVTDQPAVWLDRERSLAGTRETEEERGVPVAAGVSGTVHGGDAALGEERLEHGEDRFLDLSRVPAADDDDAPRRKVDGDRYLAGRAVLQRIGLEARRVENRPGSGTVGSRPQRGEEQVC